MMNGSGFDIEPNIDSAALSNTSLLGSNVVSAKKIVYKMRIFWANLANGIINLR